MTSLANPLEPSSLAAAAVGPKARTPASTSASTTPASASTRRASAAMPALPGAQSTSGRWGERASARTSACSRPPAPTTSARKAPSSEPGDEVVHRDGGQRLVLRRAARAELHRDPGDCLLVRRLDDVDEVEVPERRPLRLHRRAELLDLL